MRWRLLTERDLATAPLPFSNHPIDHGRGLYANCRYRAALLRHSRKRGEHHASRYQKNTIEGMYHACTVGRGVRGTRYAVRGLALLSTSPRSGQPRVAHDSGRNDGVVNETLS